MSSPLRSNTLSRRQLIPMLGCAGALLAGCKPLSTKPPTGFNFEISLAQWSLHKALFAHQISALDFPEITRKRYDIGAVEYVNQFFLDKAQDKTFLQALKQRCSDNGVVSSLIMIDNEPPLASGNSNERQAGVEGHKKWIEAAKYLGCSAIRVNLHGSNNLVEWTQGAIESLQALSAIGKPLGIRILVENHGGFSSNGRYLVDVIRQVQATNVFTMPDFGNFCVAREVAGDLWKSACVERYDPYMGVAELMPYAGAFSAKSFDFDANGNESSIDFYKMFAIMKASAYRGFVGIEYEGKALSEDEGIRATKRLIERVKAQLQS